MDEGITIPKIQRSIHHQDVIVGGSHDWLVEGYSTPSIHEATIIEHLSLLCLIEHQVVRGVYETDDFVQRVQSVAEFRHLRPQNRVLSFHLQVHLRRHAYVPVHFIVLLFQLIQLGTQTFQVLLFPHARSACRFPVRLHSLSLPLIHHVSVALGARVLKRTGTG
ncbi:hypothetical protein VIGAN_01113900 [Vigna angularis var. angularis]|uniref:Uncharacterized protein n=1 Tax=Vigna angularis var. angularis TaxID=157739 RepID=A0A0S3QZ53_PHAAN|nr:hypothetical protein VIGAN_01113900 [Vigna angularis var. angularis]